MIKSRHQNRCLQAVRQWKLCRQITDSIRLRHLSKKTKPVDVHGVSFSWEIMDTPPTTPDDLRHSVFRVKTVEIFDFKEDERGKKVYYAARYENAKGEAGPWSDIVMAIIP
jgi:hypothetical protein